MALEMIVDFPGGAKVDVHFNKFTVHTDQPVKDGGEDTAPSPFLIFLSSLASCAGVYANSFCRQRNLSTEGMRITQRLEVDRATGMVTKVMQEIQLPVGFPEEYRAALLRSVELCTVKKHLEKPPQFEITTVAVETA